MDLNNNENHLILNQEQQSHWFNNENNDLNLQNEEPQAFFNVQDNQLSFDAPKTISGGTNDHEKLTNREKANQHPIQAITGLEQVLKDLGDVSVKLLTNITYEELKQLADNSKLEVGAIYRITDYVTMSTQPNTQSAGHQFDIIIRALGENILDEEAKAIQSENDEYFANSNLSAWQVWYTLDNDISKYGWADEENGKGVIYRLIDENGNDAPYDFKNIQMQDANNSDDTNYYYTFDNNGTDHSLNGSLCFDNKMERYVDKNQKINRNIFKSRGNETSTNVFDYECYNNTFNNTTTTLKFERECYGNVFGGYNHMSRFGTKFRNNNVGSETQSITVGQGASNNAFGANIYYSTFGNYFRNNKVARYTYYSSFGHYVQNFIMGTDANNVGHHMRFLTIENGVTYVNLYKTDTTTTTYMENIKICSGTNGTSSNRINIEVEELAQKYAITYGKNSSGELVKYCEEDVQDVDLSNYYTKEEIDGVVQEVGQIIDSLNETMPQIVPLEEYNPEEQYADNQITNANTMNYVIGMVGEAFDGMNQYIEEVRQEAQENIFTVNYTLNPQNMSITYVSHYSADIIQAFNEGKKVCFSGYVLGLNVYVNSELQLVDGQYVYTYPLLRTDLGEGEKNYLFKIRISSDSTLVQMNEIGAGGGGTDDTIFLVEYIINLSVPQVTYVSKTQQEIIDAYNSGKKVMFRGTVTSTGAILSSELNTIDSGIPYTYPFLRTDLGEGIYNYFFRISVYREFGNVEPYALVDVNKLNQTVETLNNTMSNIAMSRPDTNTVVNIVNFYVNEALRGYQNRLLPENPTEGSTVKYENGAWVLAEENIFTVEYQINPQTMTITDISHFSGDIIDAYNNGKKVTFRGYVLGLGVYVNSELEMVDGNYALTFPLIRGDLGMGTMNYLFDVLIMTSSTRVTVHVLQEITQ